MAAILMSPFASADGLAFCLYLKPGFPDPYAGVFEKPNVMKFQTARRMAKHSPGIKSGRGRAQCPPRVTTQLRRGSL